MYDVCMDVSSFRFEEFFVAVLSTYSYASVSGLKGNVVAAEGLEGLASTDDGSLCCESTCRVDESGADTDCAGRATAIYEYSDYMSGSLASRNKHEG